MQSPTLDVGVLRDHVFFVLVPNRVVDLLYRHLVEVVFDPRLHDPFDAVICLLTTNATINKYLFRSFVEFTVIFQAIAKFSLPQ